MYINTRGSAFAKFSIMLRRIAPALGLFFLSPLVAEFLLGNISISAIADLFFLAPMYGGGAILLREVTRRTGYGWPTMILLGLAYGVIEEGLVTQTLFNPSYFGIDLLSATHIPMLGIGAWWTLFVLTLHTIWSTSVPIAFVESLVHGRRETPWLDKIGLVISGGVFILGAIANFYGTYVQESFIATVPQLIGTIIAIVLLIIIAFIIDRQTRPLIQTMAPNPWLVGGVSFVVSSMFMVGQYLHGWETVGIWLVLFAAMATLFTKWSRSKGWGNTHRVALAGGALLTYSWNAFPEEPVIGAKGTVDLVGNVVFALGAIVLLLLTLYKVRK